MATRTSVMPRQITTWTYIYQNMCPPGQKVPGLMSEHRNKHLIQGKLQGYLNIQVVHKWHSKSEGQLILVQELNVLETKCCGLCL